MLYSRNRHNTVNQLYFNKFFFFKGLADLYCCDTKRGVKWQSGICHGSPPSRLYS